ncbi:sterol desaturase family protein [bacterium]|nr:sterol desaturase family protein [bacterium]
MNYIYAISFALMLAAVLVEAVALKFTEEKSISWLDLLFNMDSGHIVMWFFRGIEISGYTLIYRYSPFNMISPEPSMFIWILGFFAWDFGFYWLHRYHHKIKLLWAVHVVHHEGEHFNLSLGARNSWYSSITSLPFFAPMALIGINPVVFVGVSSIHYTVQLYNHCGLIKNSGILDKFMITPKHHRIHHGLNLEYVDKNFGGTFLVWDKLFGTFQKEIPHIPVQFGIKKPFGSLNPFWASHLPIMKFFGFHKVSVSTKKQKTSLSRILIYGLLSYAAAIWVILSQPTIPFVFHLILVLIVCMQTVALGAMSEDRKWGEPSWLGMQVLLILVFFIFL